MYMSMAEFPRMSARILVVEDDAVVSEDLRDILGEFGYTTDVVSTGLDAIAYAERSLPDLVLMDIQLHGGMDGTEAARVLRERFNVPSVYLSGYADLETLERAKIAEPLGYIGKPWVPGGLRAGIEIALHKHAEDLKSRQRESLLSAALQEVLPLLHPHMGESAAAPMSLVAGDSVDCGEFHMVAASQAMKQLIAFARRVAMSDVEAILLEGESGTGKDVMARFMHHFGKRRHMPFVALNCAAIPETLLESELFGYEAGAFTDARVAKPGILEMVSGGTVFLDEIGEMPVAVQAKLLRVLEDQTFRRLGGLRDVHVDLCLVAASNRNLADAVELGRFRTDLYYRLNVIQVLLPPLRERKADILPLAKHFIEYYNHKLKRNILGVTTGAATAMLDHGWPGNIRELRNSIERGVLLEEMTWLQSSSLRLDNGVSHHLAPEPKPVASTSFGRGMLEEGERQTLIEALEQTRWNQSRAAGLLGISRDTLRCKIKRYSLPRPISIAESRT